MCSGHEIANTLFFRVESRLTGPWHDPPFFPRQMFSRRLEDAMRNQLSKPSWVRLAVTTLIFTLGIALLTPNIQAHGGNSDQDMIHACVKRSTDQVEIVG